MARSGMILTPVHRAWVYGSFAVLFVSGAVWMALHQWFSITDAFGTQPSPLEVPARALHGVSLDVPERSVFALIGPSGCGKTTLLRSLNRLTELTRSARVAGSVLHRGTDVYGRGVDPARVRRGIGMVFQQPNPFPMSIFENVAFALREQSRRRPRKAVLRPAVERALVEAGLWDEVSDALDRSAFALSGGQQQRLCIARTLAAGPDVILMDEPCSALDPRSTARIEETIRALRERMTVVIVTHNLAQARRVADHVAFLLDGRILEAGTAEQVMGSPRVQETRDYIAGVFG